MTLIFLLVWQDLCMHTQLNSAKALPTRLCKADCLFSHMSFSLSGDLNHPGLFPLLQGQILEIEPLYLRDSHCAGKHADSVSRQPLEGMQHSTCFMCAQAQVAKLQHKLPGPATHKFGTLKFSAPRLLDASFTSCFCEEFP